MRKFWMILLGLILIAPMTFSQGQPNKEAARIVLLDQAEIIRTFIVSLPQKSKTISKDDLFQLQDMINYFDSLRMQFQKTYSISYPFSIFKDGDVPKIAYLFNFKNALDKYYNSTLWHQDDKAQTLKNLFLAQTGTEVNIEKTKNWGDRILMGIIGGIFVGLLFGMFIGLAADSFEVFIALFLVTWIIWACLFLCIL